MGSRRRFVIGVQRRVRSNRAAPELESRGVLIWCRVCARVKCVGRVPLVLVIKMCEMIFFITCLTRRAAARSAQAGRAAVVGAGRPATVAGVSLL